MKRLVHNQAEPFFFEGDEIGCLLIHGFTSATADVRLLGEYLARQGRTVFGPRLFGHGTQEADLDRARYQDWLASAEDGYHLLRPRCRQIFVGGLSVGGALALLLSARLPVDGVFGLATAYSLPDDPRLAFARPISLVWRRIKKSGKGDWWDMVNRELHYSYPHYPTPAVVELSKLLAEMRRALPTLQAPALLIQAKRDESLAVPPEAMASIAQRLGSPDVTSHWLEHSGHVVTLDSERERVFELVSDFINRVTAENHPRKDSKSSLR